MKRHSSSIILLGLYENFLFLSLTYSSTTLAWPHVEALLGGLIEPCWIYRYSLAWRYTGLQIFIHSMAVWCSVQYTVLHWWQVYTVTMLDCWLGTHRARAGSKRTYKQNMSSSDYASIVHRNVLDIMEPTSWSTLPGITAQRGIARKDSVVIIAVITKAECMSTDTMRLNPTQLNWTDLCSSARVLSSCDPVGINYRSTIDINKLCDSTESTIGLSGVTSNNFELTRKKSVQWWEERPCMYLPVYTKKMIFKLKL